MLSYQPTSSQSLKRLAFLAVLVIYNYLTYVDLMNYDISTVSVPVPLPTDYIIHLYSP